MFTQLARSLAAILEPLRAGISEPARLDQLLASAGWVPSEALDAGSVDAVAAALGIGDDLDALASLTDGDVTVVDAVIAIEAGSSVLRRLTELAGADPATLDAELADVVEALPPPFDDVESVLLAISDVGAALVSQWLAAELPIVRTALRSAGTSSGGSPERVDWPALLELLTDPGSSLAEAYGWGESLSIVAVDRAVRALGDMSPRPLRVTDVEPAIAAKYWGEGVTPPGDVRQYETTILEPGSGLANDLSTEVALVVVPVPDGPGSGPYPTGILLAPVASAGVAIPITLSETWAATVSVDADLPGTTGLTLRPSANAGVAVAAESDAPELGLGVTLSAPDLPWTLGDPGGVRIESAGFELAGGIRDRDGHPEPFLVVTPVGGLVLTLAPPEHGGFLRFLLGDGLEVSVAADFDVSTSGLRVSGGLGIAFSLLIERNIGPLYVERVTVALDAGSEAAALEAVVAASLTIGPVVIGEEGLGIAFAARSDRSGGGSLGELDLGLELVEPWLLVITVASEAVNGGGFIAHEPDSSRYAGGLALDIFGFGLSAIVIVDTELPGDPDGWALFGSLGLEFPTPIPIGFGFTLNGVGGLLALNRTMNIDALAGDLSTGAADSILFPDNLEEDAEAVLAGLDLWFPAKDGSTVFGPVVLIGWGSPETLVTAQLGVVIALPDLIIAVLGSVEVLLPTPDEAVLSLRMDVIGAVDVPASTIIVAASLHDSNLLGIFELSGDMGFYTRLSGQPLFVLSVGGYHPQFDPPGALPSWLLELRQTRAAVPLGDSVEVVLTSYVAVTSNTFQFGGRFTLEASVKVALTTYTAEGWFGVNVLLVFKPFKIVARATAGVSVSAGDRELFGVDLVARVEGPEPWFATGRASFTFFGFDVEFGFEVGSQPGGEPREIHDVAADVVEVLSQPTAWEAAEPADTWASGIVVTDQLPEGLWVRPDQVVELRQSIAPLNRTMTAYGEFVPAADRIDAAEVTLGGDELSSPEWLDDWFAPAQFDRLDDTTRLSSPSFELMTAGVRFGDDGIGISARPDAECTSVSREPEESIFPDEDSKPSRFVSTARPATTMSPTRTVAGERITLSPTSYTVVRKSDAAVADAVLADAGSGSSLSYADAVAVVAGRTATERSRLKVAPSHAAVEREPA